MSPSILSLRAAAIAAVLAAGCGKVNARVTSHDSVAAASLASAGGVPTDSISERADHGRIQGSPNATLWFIEASDFQCPFCKTFHDSTYPQILHDYVQTGKIRMAYLNFPLRIHQYSQVAAEAAMCASAQNHFWPMHDSLFASQDRWAQSSDPRATFETLAKEVGVDAAAWRSCMDTHATRPLIEADQDRSQSAGVQSTPSFFIGSRRLIGAAPFSNFRDTIEAELRNPKQAGR